jgi:hypothetical protein
MGNFGTVTSLFDYVYGVLLSALTSNAILGNAMKLIEMDVIPDFILRIGKTL